MKIGDLVEFSYGRVGGQINGIGILAEVGLCGKHKVLFMGKGYWVPSHFVKVISMVRKPDVSDERLN
jgi:DNA/RNA endonuclease G (NUC1)